MRRRCARVSWAECNAKAVATCGRGVDDMVSSMVPWYLVTLRRTTPKPMATPWLYEPLQPLAQSLVLLEQDGAVAAHFAGVWGASNSKLYVLTLGRVFAFSGNQVTEQMCAGRADAGWVGTYCQVLVHEACRPNATLSMVPPPLVRAILPEAFGALLCAPTAEPPVCHVLFLAPALPGTPPPLLPVAPLVKGRGWSRSAVVLLLPDRTARPCVLVLELTPDGAGRPCCLREEREGRWFWLWSSPDESGLALELAVEHPRTWTLHWACVPGSPPEPER